MNLYKILGIAKDADKLTIKKAFKKMAQKLHPDREGGNVERFHMVKAAYDVLSDDERRQRYDETGETDKPKDARSIAEDQLANIFNEIISRQNWNGNIVMEARKVIDDANRKLGMLTKTIEGEIKRINKLSGRVTAKKTNLCQRLIDAKLEQLERELKHAKEEQKTVDLIYELVGEYEDDFEPPKPSYVTAGMTGLYSGSTV